MKMILKPMLFIFIIMTLFSSCNNEELFTEPTAEEIVDPNTPDDETPEDSEEETGNASAPCNFNLNNLQPNQTVIINCIMDLDGATINVPSGVTILYEGGEIINGTLNFSDNATVSSDILNSTLTLTGSNPIMKDPEFEFIPSKWGIVEGVVSDAIALKNKEILKAILWKVSELGINTFKIDKLDAYFKVDNPPQGTTPTQFAITIPSDFNLVMTDNTHLRIQPNNYKQPTLLSVLDVSNVTIDGGILHGERDEHDYSDGGTHEWETLISIKAGENITVKNVTMMDSAGDGMSVSNLYHSYEANYTPSVNVLISNNTFLRNRRNQLSITDGRQVVVENNEFIDASIHTNKSRGTAPGYAIDVEAVIGSNPDGPQQIAQDIIIRNNIEKRSRIGGFTVHTGDRVTIEGNQMENEISYSTTTGTIIRNNILIAIPGSKSNTNGTAITAGRRDRYDRNYGNRVYGNMVEGFSTGIDANNTDLEVYENEIINCVSGIKLNDITFSKIYNNTIKSSVASSDGILNGAASSYLNEVQIFNNTIDVTRSAMLFVGQNDADNEGSFNFYVNKNTLVSGAPTISNSEGFNLVENIFHGTLRLANASRGKIEKNTISSSNDGIRIDSGCIDILIYNNNISANGRCVWFNNSDALNIIETNNTCN